jgi:dihydrofolate reductase
MIIFGPVAVADNGVIGKGNDLPWHLPEDLKHFKQLTLGKAVLMGRKTFDSIFARLNGPLPNRKNIIITRQPDYTAPEGVLVFHSLQEAIKDAPEDIYVIGGAEIFKQALPYCEKAYITHIHGDYEGDAYLPEIDWSEWKKTESEPHENYEFATYEK